MSGVRIPHRPDSFEAIRGGLGPVLAIRGCECAMQCAIGLVAPGHRVALPGTTQPGRPHAALGAWVGPGVEPCPVRAPAGHRRGDAGRWAGSRTRRFAAGLWLGWRPWGSRRRQGRRAGVLDAAAKRTCWGRSLRRRRDPRAQRRADAHPRGPPRWRLRQVGVDDGSQDDQRWLLRAPRPSSTLLSGAW